jgi:hypothetical protein
VHFDAFEKDHLDLPFSKASKGREGVEAGYEGHEGLPAGCRSCDAPPPVTAQFPPVFFPAERNPA